MSSPTTIVLFNRDLRVHDHPALRAAASRGRVIPLFVLDNAIQAPANRMAFLVGALRDLDGSLTKLGAPLVVRRGEPSAVVASLGADDVYVSADYTPIATRREEALGAHTFAGVACVEPGAVVPTGAEHFTVFTPYWRRWREHAGSRTVLQAPRTLEGIAGLRSEALPAVQPTAPDLPAGGEGPARKLLAQLARRTKGYADGGHDDLAADHTSRLSPYLHFGCLSPRQVMDAAAKLGADGDALIRQLCWRDFYLQYFAANPPERTRLATSASFRRWQDGETGVDIVDAGMRQLLREGWMHNRARMITASYLVNELGVDWRHGAAHFMEHLVDGDVANNTGNWMWVAHWKLNQRPRPPMNPERQAKRFDPRGEYVARYLDRNQQQSLGL